MAGSGGGYRRRGAAADDHRGGPRAPRLQLSNVSGSRESHIICQRGQHPHDQQVGTAGDGPHVRRQNQLKPNSDVEGIFVEEQCSTCRGDRVIGGLGSKGRSTNGGTERPRRYGRTAATGRRVPTDDGVSNHLLRCVTDLGLVADEHAHKLDGLVGCGIKLEEIPGSPCCGEGHLRERDGIDAAGHQSIATSRSPIPTRNRSPGLNALPTTRTAIPSPSVVRTTAPPPWVVEIWKVSAV